MKHIHTESHSSEKGWIETTTRQSYYLDEKTGEVVYEEHQDCDNPYKKTGRYENRLIERRVLKPHEIPAEVRAKIRQLIEKKG